MLSSPPSACVCEAAQKICTYVKYCFREDAAVQVQHFFLLSTVQLSEPGSQKTDRIKEITEIQQ